MAQVTRRESASLDASTGIVAPQISGDLVAGEDLDNCSACYIAADGKAYMSDGAAAGAKATFHGICPRAAKRNQAVSLYGPGTRFGYGDGMTPGALYLGTAPGTLADAATTGGTDAVAFAVSSRDIMVAAYQL